MTTPRTFATPGGVHNATPPRVVFGPGTVAGLRDEVVVEIATELNVKRVEAVNSLEGLLDYTVVPNFRTLGPDFPEGIETDGQLQRLVAMGCDHAQGFLFSRPLPTNKAEELVKARLPLGPKGARARAVNVA